MTVINTTESAIRARAAKLGVRYVKCGLSDESCEVHLYIEDGGPMPMIIAYEFVGDCAHLRPPRVKKLTPEEAGAALFAAFSLPGNPVPSHATFLLNRCLSILGSERAHLLLNEPPAHGRPTTNQARDDQIIHALANAWSLGIRKGPRRVADSYGISEERVKEIMAANKIGLKTEKAVTIDGVLRLVERDQGETVSFLVSGVTVIVKRGV